MIKGDSGEYELLAAAVKSAYKLQSIDYYLTCEIGVREGMGSKIMMDEIQNKNHGTHHHIGIDPYGDLTYVHFDENNAVVEHPKTDYTNLMKLRLKKDLIDYPNFHLMEMTDCEFMSKYRSGLTIYDDKPKLLDKYTVVHFDGPHRTVDVLREVLFFCDRSHVGTTFCFDDYKLYNMELIECACMEHGFKEIKKGDQKKVLRKEYET